MQIVAGVASSRAYNQGMPAVAETRTGVDRLFQFSILLLSAHGFLSFLATGRLDAFSILAVAAAWGIRLLRALNLLRLQTPRWLATAAALVLAGSYPLDAFYLSGDFMDATLRLMFLFTALKLVIAERGRDFFYLGVLSYLQLLAASIFIGGPEYAAILVAFLFLAILAYTSFEIRRGIRSPARVVEAQPLKGGRNLGPRLAVLSGMLVIAIGTLSAGLFFILPRPPGKPLVTPLRGQYGLGFFDAVNLDKTGELVPDHRPVMRAESFSGQDLSGLLWRGVSLSQFDGLRWSTGAEKSRIYDAQQGSQPLRGFSLQAGHGRRLDYRVTLEPLPVGALFIAGQPEVVTGSFSRLKVTDSGSYLVPGGDVRPIAYRAVSWVPDSERPRAYRAAEWFSEEFRARYLQLPEGLDERIVRLAHRLTRGAPSSLEKVEAIEAHLKEEFGYTIDLPAERSKDPLAHFLFERRRGHCEYFASAMAVMLRSLGIPARLVNGFAGGLENPLTGQQVLRSSDAHSWVEAYLAGYGWLTFDPTPAIPAIAWSGLAEPLWMYWDAVQATWQSWVLDYDLTRQASLIHKARESSRGAVLQTFTFLDDTADWLRMVWRHGVSALGRPAGLSSAPPGWLVVTLLLASTLNAFLLYRFGPRIINLYRARRVAAGFAQPSDAQFFYRRSLSILAKRGFERPAWLTAREFAASLPAAGLRHLMGEIGEAYSAARFGNDPRAEQRLPRLVAALEKGTDTR